MQLIVCNRYSLLKTHLNLSSVEEARKFVLEYLGGNNKKQDYVIDNFNVGCQIFYSGSLNQPAIDPPLLFMLMK